MAKKKSKKIIREVQPTSQIAQLAEAVSEVLGSHAVHRASDSDRGIPRLFIPSGIPDLDLVLDREGRGWPVGRIVEVFGAEATIKTGVGLALIGKCHQMGGDGILWPCEGEYDEWLALKYGIDLDRLILGDDATVEGVFGSFSKAMTKIGRKGLLVGMIDSIAGMNTKAELEEFEATGEIKRDRSAQLRAMMLSSSLRKTAAAIPRTNTILFCVNQIRSVEKQGGFGGATKEPPGGFALRFHASVRLKLEMIGKYTRQKKGERYIAGIKLRITAVKNRLARPYQEAVVLLDYDKGLLPMPKGRKKKK